MRVRALLFAAATLALIGAAGCRVNRPLNDHAAAQTLYTSTNSDPGTFNPIIVTDSASGDAIGDLFEGLIKTDAKSTLPEPDLAQSWEYSDGDKTITFHLRRDVKWSDGVPFTSRDVLFTLRAIYDPRVPNSIISSLMVDGKPIQAEAPDDHTVVIKLPRPFAPVLYSMQFPIVPAHVLDSALAQGKFTRTWGIDAPPQDLVSLGPFLMRRYVPGQLLAYKRNGGYWMRGPNGEHLPRLHGEMKLVDPDQNAQYLQFQAGLTDVYYPRPEEVWSLRENAHKLGITVAEIGVDTGSLFFAFNRNPRNYVHGTAVDPRYKWFTDVNFMRALAHAVDKRGMIDLCFRGLGVPAVSDVSPANRIYHNPNLKDYDYDLKLAARILDEAGYRMIRPGVRGDPESHPLVFDLITNTGVNIRDEMCVIFKQDLAALGIKVNYRPLDFISLVKALDSTFDWDCVLIGFSGTIEPNDGANFLSSSGNLHLWDPAQPKPRTKWEAEIDRLLADGTRVADPQKRAPYYWRIQEILHEELPIIETVRQIRYVAYRDSLRSFDPTAWGLYRPEWIHFSAQ
ncbi:MAG TPA: ABC transporter substrate-binding protein [Candidatus Binataceae bacterium]|nr:ABC transporter substrate-binding protein [Candidatus Binataceae bacterium]